VNGRKAKALRRLAQKATVGMPAVEYAMVKVGTWLVQPRSPRLHVPRSTRGLYRHLKKQLVNNVSEVERAVNHEMAVRRAQARLHRGGRHV
jgi:hypothetical protein